MKQIHTPFKRLHCRNGGGEGGILCDQLPLLLFRQLRLKLKHHNVLHDAGHPSTTLLPPPQTHAQIFKNRETKTHTHTLSLSLSLSLSDTKRQKHTHTHHTHALSLSLSLSLSDTRGDEIGGLCIIPCTLGFLGSPKTQTVLVPVCSVCFQGFCNIAKVIYLPENNLAKSGYKLDMRLYYQWCSGFFF